MGGLPERYVVVLVMFAAAATCYLDRVGFPLAYTTMAAAAGVDKETQGLVHSAFYNGYTLSQLPGGWAASRYGGERVLSLSFLLWSSASLLTPGDGRRTRALVAARVGVGGAMGVVFPSIHSLLVNWIPPHERSRAVSLFTSGMYFGSAAGTAALPLLIARHGPAAVPLAVGAAGFAWLCVWSRFASRQPGGGAVSVLPGGEAARRGRGAVPWRALARCLPLWAIVLNNVTFHYAFFILMAWLPTLYDARGADPTRLGALKMLPYLIMGLASNAGGIAADLLITRRRWSVTRTRKTLNSSGFLAASLALLALPGAASLNGTVALACAAMGSLAFARGGYSVNHMDIAHYEKHLQ